ncbi:response regulator ArlR [Clostridium pasteurianum DSM 525 = ATCC 6013]|uniref:Stage 0 sporulation protein A homolog n=1 Tax=Clostridium pasteurianum DSM 525 = ATCC 6013 TaxID=1262449 RepID=A0A0H3JB16_CLOPA|nr:response regulator transcription factor [Clostridium pasteurianum]AJA48995.1 response regulator ArlR [Clostridium pasteurianum DSM 525 = ATCC 6013]AJA52983.1 response regulator ArlR [Clostridium pasteurianum DSM 525 = ATCC 6013]AOZ76202.1 PhoB family transcriptional regulator [Clostridium pasteurianum DSM 525 = ATCC 6013]AOZ79998.1 PhoB family transcriptional regulator [Clostridium pasteurianum]ELP60291.1 response regulator receiver [Clostridium pasteurianum DSM 525 = ATCC 6013]
MSGEKILIVEDELKIARFLELELKYEGYSVEQCHDGREGLNKALSETFDLILLDIMLPSMNGIEVLRKLRQSTEIPVIMLTAKDEVIDKVMGLDMGANDYVTKPFAIEELLARIRRCLKLKPSAPKVSKILTAGSLKMDLEKYTVSFKDNSIDLTKREFDLLQYLLKNKNIVLTREKLMDTVWGYDYVGDTNVVDVYIRYLRSKIDDRYHKKLIHTVRGVGYLLKDD